MTFAVFHDFPGLENGKMVLLITWPVGTLFNYHAKFEVAEPIIAYYSFCGQYITLRCDLEHLQCITCDVMNKRRAA